MTIKKPGAIFKHGRTISTETVKFEYMENHIAFSRVARRNNLQAMVIHKDI
jgi:hypothetical protein